MHQSDGESVWFCANGSWLQPRFTVSTQFGCQASWKRFLSGGLRRGKARLLMNSRNAQADRLELEFRRAEAGTPIK